MGPVVDVEEREFEEALLRAGRNVRMTPELREKTLAALGVGVAVGLATTSAKAGTLGWLSSKTGVAAAGFVGAAGVAGAVVLSGAFTTEPRPDEHGVMARAPQGLKEEGSKEVSSEGALGTEEDEAITDVDEDVPFETTRREVQEVVPQAADTMDEPPGVAAPRSKQRAAVAPTAEPSGLREELSHIARVESALSSGDPGKALALLSEYRRRFNPPKLGLEAEVLTIQALSEKGNAAAARQRAARFVEKYPTSPLGARAKRYLE